MTPEDFVNAVRGAIAKTDTPTDAELDFMIECRRLMTDHEIRGLGAFAEVIRRIPIGMKTYAEAHHDA